METYTLDTVIMGSKKLYNKIKLMVNIADKLSWFNPKRAGLYILAGIIICLYVYINNCYDYVKIRTTRNSISC